MASSSSQGECATRSELSVENEPSLWEKNRELLKQLYIVEKKTLEKVKEDMEQMHGFPSTPFWVYEVKLREELSLRKKLKAKDWIAIRQHLLVEGNSKAEVYFQGVLIPRKKVKREISRNARRLAGSTPSGASSDFNQCYHRTNMPF
ncbi:hypothetical protein GQ53DRAFT_759240 [Thozetella sp. PMI_491]|nr:hypothetical protein GQ53DRAFT_759240 [Thozetella sp. PMI_491]